MSQSGEAGKKRGRAKTGDRPAKRKTRRVSKASKGQGKGEGAAKTVRSGRRNEEIQAEWRSGREPRALALEFGLSLSRIYEIIKDCRQAGIEELELVEPWRAQRFADEVLLHLKQAINDAREIELRARAQNNIAAELGGYKARIQATRDYTMYLQETGRLNGPQDLKFEAEVGEFWDAVSTAFHEHRVSHDVLVAIGDALGISVDGDENSSTSEPTPPPAHWRPNGEEQAAIGRMKLEARLQEAADTEAREIRKFEADLEDGDPLTMHAMKLVEREEKEEEEGLLADNRDD